MICIMQGIFDCFGKPFLVWLHLVWCRDGNFCCLILLVRQFLFLIHFQIVETQFAAAVNSHIDFMQSAVYCRCAVFLHYSL